MKPHYGRHHLIQYTSHQYWIEHKLGGWWQFGFHIGFSRPLWIYIRLFGLEVSLNWYRLI